MDRESLGKYRGMQFVFDREQVLKFWMKNTLIPLDIIFKTSTLPWWTCRPCGRGTGLRRTRCPSTPPPRPLSTPLRSARARPTSAASGLARPSICVESPLTLRSSPPHDGISMSRSSSAEMEKESCRRSMFALDRHSVNALNCASCSAVEEAWQGKRHRQSHHLRLEQPLGS